MSTLSPIGGLTQSHWVRETLVNRHINRNQCLHRRPFQTQTSKCEWKCESAKASNGYNLSLWNLTVTHVEARAVSDPRRLRYHDLDWIGWHEVEAEQPGCGCTGKDCLRWQNTAPRLECQPRIVGQL